MSDDIRAIKYTKEELMEIKKLYESLMTVASHGLFFRTGQIMGARISKMALKDKQNYFERVGKLIVEEDWAKEVKFTPNNVVVKGSIEVAHGKGHTCHMLRGVIAKIYEEKLGKKVYCHEVECESAGDEKCKFEIDTGVV
jgi:predicted hydrocarbon binding protein